MPADLPSIKGGGKAVVQINSFVSPPTVTQTKAPPTTVAVYGKTRRRSFCAGGLSPRVFFAAQDFPPASLCWFKYFEVYFDKTTASDIIIQSEVPHEFAGQNISQKNRHAARKRLRLQRRSQAQPHNAAVAGRRHRTRRTTGAWVEGDGRQVYGVDDKQNKGGFAPRRGQKHSPLYAVHVAACAGALFHRQVLRGGHRTGRAAVFRPVAVDDNSPRPKKNTSRRRNERVLSRRIQRS